MTTMFKIRVSGGNKTELDKRIADNVKRGFELVKIDERNTHEHIYRNGEYRGVNVDKRFVAVMQRSNIGRV